MAHSDRQIARESCVDLPTAPEQKVPVNPIMTENLKAQAQAPFSSPVRGVVPNV